MFNKLRPLCIKRAYRVTLELDGPAPETLLEVVQVLIRHKVQLETLQLQVPRRGQLTVSIYCHVETGKEEAFLAALAVTRGVLNLELPLG